MGGTLSKPDYDRFDRLVVVGAGFPRTGTSSMQLALERLIDGPVAHGGTHIVGGSDRLCRLWAEGIAAKRRGDKERALKNIRESTRGFAGIVDTPTNQIMPELMELYPDAKVVLVGRDPKRWADSLSGLIDLAMPWYAPWLVSIGPGMRWMPMMVQQLNDFCESLLRDAGKQTGRGYHPDILELYNQHVISVVPKEQLLIMDLAEGWEPLCKFLGKPIPDEPFPRANDMEAAAKSAPWFVMKLGLMWMGLFTGIGWTVYGGIKLLR